jgi:hypothetical protein
MGRPASLKIRAGPMSAVQPEAKLPICRFNKCYMLS